jgi:hypothetical protein
MFAQSLILDLLIVAVALAAPWSLRFDHAGLRNATAVPGGKRALFLTFATTFNAAISTGFIGLAALGMGALLRLDGMAALEALLLTHPSSTR